MDKKSKRYATIDNPTIAAVVHEMYRFASEPEARERLEILRQNFIPSKQQIDNTSHPSLHLWIKGYAVTDGDKTKGVIGHYAVITYKETAGKWYLYATKLETPPELHPQRAQIRRDNPNWGHPVLRAVRKGKVYPTLEAAQAELDLLHQHFPKVTIPNPGKLYIMIYCANRPAKERMVKHTLTIGTTPEGAYHIECKENIQKPNLPVKKRITTPLPETSVAEEPQGFFTAKVALTRHKKGKSKPTKPKPKAEQ